MEDDEPTRLLLSVFCGRNGYLPVACGSLREARGLSNQNFVAIILDLGLPDGDGIAFLQEVLSSEPDLPCIVLTMRDSARTAVDCLKTGALDYFIKPFDPEEVFEALRRVTTLSSGKHGVRDDLQLHGAVPPWLSLAGSLSHATAVEASKNLSPVLLTGEAGTGKESMARMIHGLGVNAKSKFVSVSAEAMDSEAFRAEVFGVDADSFGRPKRGHLELTENGTLYILGVEKLTLAVQVELLGFLESGHFQRLGSGCYTNANCRVIVGSSVDLEPEVKVGRFRRDLFFQLGAPGICLEPLRHRIEDMPAFCDLLLTRIALRDKRRKRNLSEVALKVLLKYSWPGNLDELKHALEFACARCDGAEILAKHLPQNVQRSRFARKTAMVPVLGSSSIGDVERASLISALALCKGNRRLAAERLGVSMRTIYNMIDRHQLRRF